MKVIAVAVCLSLLIAVANCQTTAAPTSNCAGVCTQVCGIWSQVMSVFSVFFGPLGPLVTVGHTICTNSCSWGCSLIG